jgi:hypothetical protein
MDHNVAIARVFGRFAGSLLAPSGDDAKPRNLLFDFDEILAEGARLPRGWSPTACQALAAADLCLNVDDYGAFELPVSDGATLAGHTRYEITGQVRRRGPVRDRKRGPR